MATIILMILIVFLPVAIGVGIAYFGYNEYKARRFAAPDVEQTRYIENTPQRKWQEVDLDDVALPEKQYHSGQWYGSPAIVSIDIAPVAKPLPSSPYLEFTGGEGLVSPPGRVFLSTNEENEGLKGRSREVDRFHEQEIHGCKPWDFEKDGYGKSAAQQPEVQCPKPIRAITMKPNPEPANTAYDAEQTAASDIWDKIDKGEVSISRRKPERKSRKPLVPIGPRNTAMTDKNDMEGVDLNSTKLCANREGPASSVVTVVDTNNVNIQLPVYYAKRKASIDPVATPIIEGDRAAEMRRKMAEAKKQRAERQKQEEEKQLREEERRRVREQEEREAEKIRAEEAQKREYEERQRALIPPNQPEPTPENISDPTSSQPQRRSSKRRSNVSTSSSTSRPSTSSISSQDPPSARRTKRANTIAADTLKPTTARSILTSKAPQSMSMTENPRPDFNPKMPSIIESVRPDSHGSVGSGSSENGGSRENKDAKRRSSSSSYSARYNGGRRMSQDAGAGVLDECYEENREDTRYNARFEKRVKHSGTRRSSSSSSSSQTPARRASASSSRNDTTDTKRRRSTTSRSSTSSSVVAEREAADRRPSMTSEALSKFAKGVSRWDSTDSGRRQYSHEPEERKSNTLGLHGRHVQRGDEVACETESSSEEGSSDKDEGFEDEHEHEADPPKLRGGAGSQTGGTETESERDGENAGYNEDRHSGTDCMHASRSEDWRFDHTEEEQENEHSGDNRSEDEHTDTEHSEAQNSDNEHTDRSGDEHSGDEHSEGDTDSNGDDRDEYSDSESDSSSASA
ncbi:hypothetical protein PtrSN002B_008353 [Pyrenophora tritici-repentis]|uniref:Uncharacterized protein n=2 Tax=Pyrenophora tritici-repentis TaxID=45151 RepID=A0A2W1EMY9_9PLEO|nr:uncharacterized protein PTRG_03062 [Pyrenophora tritici-repentis Pt-1C-BFP]KAA8622853.1 hypothetical protein PtrV1_04159 [Pyrenophora tritici-repentis]EDU45585.1 predicted protein [Pyrenophora tritici-repentis Pt-1C-BFP]KAF7451844.1 hypothetical protein A1F99_036210 [Pyrenophora tritici-repentis]KAI0578737.1 hypothetical protein Alg215_06184 [Pyrenophora tritici-repentis]KAI1519085.1 hypothetical protein Ptr86124_002213 [Pyrenophora tritici-repentis]